jgi:hypothetical protein
MSPVALEDLEVVHRCCHILANRLVNQMTDANRRM